MSIPWTITQESAVVVLDGKTYTVKQGDKNYDEVVRAILTQNWAAIPPLMSKGLAIQKWARGFFTFGDNVMLFKGKPIADGLYQRMVAMADAGEDPRVLMRFYERCQANPNPGSIDQLWAFLQHGGIPLTKDGCFLGYKAVRADLYDKHSGSYKYEIGKYISMPREQVQYDPNVACAPGLHVGAKDYLGSYYAGDTWLIVKVDPADVVSVPHDYNAMKLRACGMLVLGYYGADLPDLVWGDEEIGDEALESVNAEIAKMKGQTPSTKFIHDPEDEPEDSWGGDENDDDSSEEDPSEDDDEGEDDSADLDKPRYVVESDDGWWVIRDTKTDTVNYEAYAYKDDAQDEADRLNDSCEDEEEEESESPEDDLADDDEVEEDEEVDDGVIEENAREAELFQKSIATLREYAKSIGVKNAGHVPNGKAGLIAVILIQEAKAEVLPKGDDSLTAEERRRYKALDRLTTEQLLEQISIADLRRYARDWLHIVGASHIPGGKPALVNQIGKVRASVEVSKK